MSGICYNCHLGYKFNNDKIRIQNCLTDNCTSCDLNDISVCTTFIKGYNFTIIN